MSRLENPVVVKGTVEISAPNDAELTVFAPQGKIVLSSGYSIGPYNDYYCLKDFPSLPSPGLEGTVIPDQYTANSWKFVFRGTYDESGASKISCWVVCVDLVEDSEELPGLE